MACVYVVDFTSWYYICRRVVSQPQLQGAWNMRNLENAIAPLETKIPSKQFSTLNITKSRLKR